MNCIFLGKKFYHLKRSSGYFESIGMRLTESITLQLFVHCCLIINGNSNSLSYLYIYIWINTLAFVGNQHQHKKDRAYFESTLFSFSLDRRVDRAFKYSL